MFRTGLASADTRLGRLWERVSFHCGFHRVPSPQPGSASLPSGLPAASLAPTVSAASAVSVARWMRALRVLLAGAVLGLAQPDIEARVSAPAVGAEVALQDLPVQARETYRLILSGGPFPFDKDGVVFGNREAHLPKMARGQYHEYTVKTPGSRDRGARRIVCAGLPKNQPAACYYTDDHYASFRRLAP